MRTQQLPGSRFILHVIIFDSAANTAPYLELSIPSATRYCGKAVERGGHLLASAAGVSVNRPNNDGSAAAAALAVMRPDAGQRRPLPQLQTLQRSIMSKPHQRRSFATAAQCNFSHVRKFGICGHLVDALCVKLNGQTTRNRIWCIYF